jgi:hypothetical protein
VPSDIERQRFRAVLRTPEGNDVWREDVHATRAPAGPLHVAVTVPSTVLPDGDYIVTLQAYRATGDPEDVTSRAFRVVRR